MPSDPLLRLALGSGIAVLAVAAVLLLAIGVLRFRSERRRAREAWLAERWQPVLHRVLEGVAGAEPALVPGDRVVVLQLWLQCVEAVRGEARGRLRDWAAARGFAAVAGRLLAGGDASARRLGAVALGRLHAVVADAELGAAMGDGDPVLSLAAARSLLQNDPAQLPAVLERAAQREDWPLLRLRVMLAELPQELAVPALQSALRAATPLEAPRLLGMMDGGVSAAVQAQLAPLLAATQPDEVLVAALKLCADPRLLEAVRALAAHPQWPVRAQAAAALGRIGCPAQDRWRLQAMLGDSEWWVRYRAAQALAALPGSSGEVLAALAARLGDRFAADILRQVLAEGAVQEVGAGGTA